jgi:hypothetical protein
MTNFAAAEIHPANPSRSNAEFSSAPRDSGKCCQFSASLLDPDLLPEPVLPTSPLRCSTICPQTNLPRFSLVLNLGHGTSNTLFLKRRSILFNPGCCLSSTGYIFWKVRKRSPNLRLPIWIVNGTVRKGSGEPG